LWRTTDGFTWDREPADPGTFALLNTSTSSLVAAPTGFVLVGTTTLRADAQFCFQDVKTCREDMARAWFSADGRSWTTTLYDQDVSSRNEWPDRAAAIGRYVALLGPAGTSGEPPLPVLQWLLVTRDRGGHMSEEPASTPPDETQPIPTTTAPPLPLLSADATTLTLGTAWRYEWQTCTSIGPFNGTSWKHDGLLPSPYPDDWPVWYGPPLPDASSVSLFGTLELVDASHLRFAVGTHGDTIDFVPTSQPTDGC
jgi:hypothetical protein